MTAAQSKLNLTTAARELAENDPGAIPDVIAEVLGVVWDAVDEHAASALRALASATESFTADKSAVVRLIGGMAAGLIRLAADRI